jgi:hypothetical protein
MATIVKSVFLNPRVRALGRALALLISIGPMIAPPSEGLADEARELIRVGISPGCWGGVNCNDAAALPHPWCRQF